MSHVAKIKVQVKSLTALREAAKDCGCELVENVRTYKWFGKHVGDYPLPEGFTKEMLGKCDHVIRVKGADERCYEVGVVKSKKHDGFELLFDFWARGYGLQDAVGKDGNKLAQAYSTNVALRKLRADGWEDLTKVVNDDGYVDIVAYK